MSSDEIDNLFNRLLDKYKLCCGPLGSQGCADNILRMMNELIDMYKNVYPELSLDTRLPERFIFC